MHDATQNSTVTTLTNSSGQYSLNLADLSTGYAEGDSISIYASYGRYHDEETFSVSIAEGGKIQNLTIEHELETAISYTSVQRLKDHGNIQTAEYNDQALNNMIVAATSEIEERTGRAWRRITVTNEYYDGDDTDILWTDNTDLLKVTAMSIDDDDDGTYTALTVTDPWAETDDIFVYSEGRIVLNDDATVNRFTRGNKTVKVTYQYGHDRPSERIRSLCEEIVLNKIHLEPERTKHIENEIRKKKWKGPKGFA